MNFQRILHQSLVPLYKKLVDNQGSWGNSSGIVQSVIAHSGHLDLNSLKAVWTTQSKYLLFPHDKSILINNGISVIGMKSRRAKYLRAFLSPAGQLATDFKLSRIYQTYGAWFAQKEECNKNTGESCDILRLVRALQWCPYGSNGVHSLQNQTQTPQSGTQSSTILVSATPPSFGIPLL